MIASAVRFLVDLVLTALTFVAAFSLVVLATATPFVAALVGLRAGAVVGVAAAVAFVACGWWQGWLPTPVELVGLMRSRRRRAGR